MSWSDRFSLEFNGPEDLEGQYNIGILDEIVEAYMGVISHPNGPPIACYSHELSAHILSKKWRITKKSASNVIDYIAQNASGDTSPAFLKT
tara:strand:+ start:1568 stop:1840 length:273 start_codon:yes stop_codon:yes gene_type:complete